MTKSIQQIKQELDSTKSAVAKMAVELQDRYQDYLNQLGQSVKQQLILASYQICTQFYPQSFLKLSLTNKQNLQQTLRQISNDIQPKLLNIIEQKELEPEPNELNLMAELIKNLPKSASKVKSKANQDPEIESAENIEPIDLESVKAELANIEFVEIDLTESPDLANKIEATSETPATEKIEFDNPQHLLLWHKQIERKIKKSLEFTSKQANKHLQDAQVIPDRIPSKIIDVAIQTEANRRGKGNHRLPNAPNILHLAIETEQNKKSKIPKNLSQISLLRLRLAEIEFSDPMLNAQRGKIRNLISKIHQLNNQYQATENQLAIAEAQAAWRSSWYEN